MKNPTIYFLLLFCIALVLSVDAKPKEYGNTVVSEVVEVYDGDTFFVTILGWPEIIGQRIGVRVLGIDSPEMHDKNPEVKLAALKAKAYARNILETAKVVTLKNIKRDKYFRILADVDVDGVDFAKLMLDNGFAKQYDGGHKDGFTAEEISKLESETKINVDEDFYEKYKDDEDTVYPIIRNQ